MMDYAYMANTEENIFEEIAEQVDIIWRKKWWSKEIHDDDTQWKLITAMRLKYIYPDYLELVGKPTTNDYTSSGDLTIKRKIELLLIGCFKWRDLIIAKHPSVFGYCPFGKPGWKIDDKGWYVALDYDGLDRLDSFTFFTPLMFRAHEKLERYLVSRTHDLGKFDGVLPIDGNVFNCTMENLQIINLKGRPMRCKKCGRRVTKEFSRLFRIHSTKQRYCLDCIEIMANWNL